MTSRKVRVIRAPIFAAYAWPAAVCTSKPYLASCWSLLTRQYKAAFNMRVSVVGILDAFQVAPDASLELTRITTMTEPRTGVPGSEEYTEDVEVSVMADDDRLHSAVETVQGDEPVVRLVNFEDTELTVLGVIEPCCDDLTCFGLQVLVEHGDAAFGDAVAGAFVSHAVANDGHGEAVVRVVAGEHEVWQFNVLVFVGHECLLSGADRTEVANGGKWADVSCRHRRMFGVDRAAAGNVSGVHAELLVHLFGAPPQEER